MCQYYNVQIFLKKKKLKLEFCVLMVGIKCFECKMYKLLLVLDFI